jgi:thiol-disulfide isomerase/thioredoxin
MDETVDVFFVLYAPWCGHCSEMLPEWVQFAGEIATHEDATRDPATGIVTFSSGGRFLVAMMDAESNEATPQFSVVQYPTFYLATASLGGKLAPRQYQGERTAGSFKSFLMEHAETLKRAKKRRQRK